VHSGNHQAVVQEPELHVLTANRRASVVLFQVAANLFQHQRVDFEAAPLGRKVERLAAVQVVVELAVGSEAGEGPASDEATLPQPAQPPVYDILIPACEPDNLGSRTEPIPQDGFEDVQVPVRDRPRGPETLVF
jgi:hypothetical protein